MFIKAEIAEKTPYDLCIVGAGPAGIIVALEFAALNPDARVLLLECGENGTTVNPLDESVRVTNLQNHSEPYECTNKGLGGSSMTWGGRCVMYDEIDFLPHGPVQEHCTWSVAFRNKVLPYIDQTASYFLCGDAAFLASEVDGARNGGMAEGFKSGEVSDQCLERWSLPTRFGRQYQDELGQSQSIHVLTGFFATGFSGLDEQGRVSVVNATALDGKQSLQLSAARVVISSGGHESTRLLLKSPQLFGRLNEPPQALGKYYQGHISGKIARIKFYGDPEQTDFGFMKDKDGVYCRRRFQLSTEALVERGLLNTAFWLDNPPYYDAAHGNGVMSFIYLMLICPVLKSRLLPPAIWRSVTGGEVREVKKHLLNILKGLPMSFFTPVSIFVGRYFRKRSLPGVYLKSDDNRYALHFHAEQIPWEENRMELSADGSELVLTYGYADEDVESVLESHRVLDEYLRELDCGELEYIYDEEERAEKVRSLSTDGLHQVGTIRISSSPETGVVDENLKVWGTDNVYVCSSAVFPTSGQANPTFFLGACAVRLAKHLTQTA